MTERLSYPSDLSDLEYALIEDLIPQPKRGGRPAKYERREIVNGVRYVLRTGCAWRLVPHDLPKWKAIYHYFSLWKLDGTWKRIHDRLYGDLRQSMGRNREPSAAIIDSQSVKTTEKGGRTDTMRARRSMVASGISS
jgi:putative transposase